MHGRRSIRLAGYDYRTPGAYFVTICTHQRQWLFEDPHLHEIVTNTWHTLPQRFPTITLDEFVIMPNHVHFIVWLNDPVETVGAGLAPAPPAPALPDIVRTFKSLIAHRWLQWIKQCAPHRSARVWQRNYYEAIVRDDDALANIRAYIRNNPTRWDADRDNLAALVVRMTCHEG